MGMRFAFFLAPTDKLRELRVKRRGPDSYCEQSFSTLVLFLTLYSLSFSLCIPSHSLSFSLCIPSHSFSFSLCIPSHSLSFSLCYEAVFSNKILDLHKKQTRADLVLLSFFFFLKIHLDRHNIFFLCFQMFIHFGDIIIGYFLRFCLAVFG